MTAQMPRSDTVLLTIRGRYHAPTVEAARALHNETAGLPQSISGSRALGDLTHKVYVPALEAGSMAGASDGELLILDIWKDAEGIQKFFSDSNVQAGGKRLFSERTPTVWMPAVGAYGAYMQAPAGRDDRYLGVLRAAVRSPHDALAAFRDTDEKGISDARRLGLISHQLYFRLGEPDAPTELLGVDLWFDAAGMVEYYRNHMGGLMSVFSGPPATSVWKQPPGHWIEW